MSTADAMRAAGDAAPARRSHRGSMRRAMLAGVAVIGIFGASIGTWALSTPLAGAVIASGQFVVDGNVRRVQHPTGGVVAELRVRDGATVRTGDVLIRLDETLTRANLLVINSQIAQLFARQLRLEAERAGQPVIRPPADMATTRDLPGFAEALAEEQRFMATRRGQREGVRAQLEQRIGQLREEIAGIDAQIDARGRQIALIEQELGSIRDLFQRNLVPLTRIMPLEREAVSISGQRGGLQAQRAQTEGRIAETVIQRLQIDADHLSEVGRDLREVQLRLAELYERRVAAEDQLMRVEMRAPADGIVHQLSVHTIGGVIQPAEQVMLIVPVGEGLQVEGRVAPTDIDQVRPGQIATIRVMAGNQRVTPEVQGEVIRVSPDAVREQQTNLIYYTVRILVPESERRRLGALEILPGMQAEAFLRTTDRTPFDYLIKPLMDQYNRAFRER
jgi:HlyD family secretion protein